MNNQKPPNYREGICCSNCDHCFDDDNNLGNCELFRISIIWDMFCDSHTSLQPIFTKKELERIDLKFKYSSSLSQYNEVDSQIKDKLDNLLKIRENDGTIIK